MNWISRVAIFLTSVLMSLQLLSTDASADPIQYTIRLEVAGKSQTQPAPFDDFGFESVQAGDVFWGSFTTDDSVLTTDSDSVPGQFTAFRIQLGTLIWDMSKPFPESEFAGFRGPSYIGQSGPFGFGVPSAGVRVENGEIVDLAGGVVGIADPPFINFSGQFNVGFNQFDAFDQEWVVSGRLTVTPIPEPSTLVFFAVGGLGLIWLRRRCKAC